MTATDITVQSGWPRSVANPPADVFRGHKDTVVEWLNLRFTSQAGIRWSQLGTVAKPLGKSFR
jgi:hypothetical protein